jgi:hypothetical protein
MTLNINFVWIGAGALRPLEKFNVYSWRALGHAVTIYTYNFRNGRKHDLSSLGLTPGSASLVDLPTLLRNDDKRSTERSPTEDQAYLALLQGTSETRRIMWAWYRAAENAEATKELIYNMVDITKSYIAGTRIGIVLDLKIGPSEHLARCEAAGIFEDYFVSYVRGASTTPGAPENQCMGTMQVVPAIRTIYACRFEKALTAFGHHNERAGKPNDKHLDWLTSLHAKGWAELQRSGKKALDVTDSKAMATKGLTDMTVKEIDEETNFGPFRVFKLKADQSNTSLASTTPESQLALAQHAFTQQRRQASPNPGFLRDMQQALALVSGN